MEFEQLTVWGDVDPGTELLDRKGNLYTVQPQNEKGFVALRNESGGEHQAFEALDAIDHHEFRLAGRR